MEPVPLIDIHQVICDKAPRIAKFIPRFFIRFLQRIVHQKELNRVLMDNTRDGPLGVVQGVLSEMKISYVARGFDEIPEGKRYVFVSNHPLGGLDGLILMDQISKKFPDFRFVVNDVLMNISLLSEVFLPVNKFGRQKQQYVELFDETFASNAQIIFFPAGLCSRKIDGKITDLPWSKTFLVKAIQYRRDIVPVFFTGQNSRFFYALANIRKRLKILPNVEMFFLPDEMFRQKGKKLSLSYGEPIPWDFFDDSASIQEWVEYVRKKVYELA